MLTMDRICDLPTGFRPCDFRVTWAASDWERTQALALRRAVFCIEQGIFVGDDRDAVDDHAQLLVAVSQVGGMADQVVGTVRIHRGDDGRDPRQWWGSRLAVHAAFRQHGRIGATLIRLAVSSALARGCERFLAQVQAQNQALFEQLHWCSLGRLEVHGRPHALMQADLDRYAPCLDTVRGLATRGKVR